MLLQITMVLSRIHYNSLTTKLALKEICDKSSKRFVIYHLRHNVICDITSIHLGDDKLLDFTI